MGFFDSIASVVPQLAGGAAGFALGGPVGAAIGLGAGNAFSQYQTNQQQMGLAAGQMDFQERMRNTAHRAEVADLKAAGLNPILSANAGASSPSGSMPNLSAPEIDVPSVINAMTTLRAQDQTQQQIDQGQQKINIDKSVAAAGITKDMSQTELNKLDALLKKGGKLSEWLGTSGGEVMDSGTHKVKSLMEYLKQNQPKMNNLNMTPRR